MPSLRNESVASSATGRGRRRRAPSGEAARTVALDAAGELLVTRGLVGVTIDAVAKRSGVSTQRIRRWWPTEEALALDVLHNEWKARARRIVRGAHGWGL
jgi:AcrR family transcriptional regulator